MAAISFGSFWTKAFFLFLTAAGFMQLLSAQTLEANPEFDVGDKWTYQFQNISDRQEPYIFSEQAFKSGAGSGWLYCETRRPDPPRAKYIVRYDYKRAEIKEGFEFVAATPTTPGRRYLNRQPYDDKVQFPLTVGKKYKVNLEWSNGEGNTKYDAEVQAYEKVKTPYGEVEAYRIKLAGWWTRTANGSGSGKAEETIFFAPSVKRYVRWEYFDRNSNGSMGSSELTELIKWEPKNLFPEVFDPFIKPLAMN